MMGRTEPTLTATALRDPRRWTSGPGSWSFRKGATWLPRLLLLVFGAFAAAGPASAHHFHYVNITDSRYSPDILFDLFGEDPLERWIVFTGNDQFSFIDDTFDIYGVSQPQGTVQAIFDFPFFENVANPRTTVYIELRINLLDTSGQQTIELGFTDLANEIKWDEAARRVTATQDPGNRVLNTPRLGPNFPLSVHLYYHMADWVAKAVATDTDGTNQTTLFDWTGTQQPFRNFFPFPGTDPDNLDIYSFVKCEAECEVQMIAWGTLTCDTVDGAIDLESCDSTDLAIAQDDGRTTAVPGRSLTYTIEATNRGLFDVVGATVTDAFPPALACDWTCQPSAGASCTASGSGDIDELVDLEVGASVELTAICAIDPAATGALINVAAVSPPTGFDDPFVNNNAAIDADLLTPQADLWVTLTDSQGSAVPGEALTYVLTASNFGPSAVAGATVTDAFPAALQCDWLCFESGGAACAPSGSGDITELVDLPVGAVASFFATCAIEPTATGSLVNEASVSAPSGVSDFVSANDADVDVDLLTPAADLVLTKTDGVRVVIPGQPVTYTVTARNEGPSDAPASHVQDNLPAELIDCSWTCSAAAGATCTSGPVAGDVDDTVDLPPGSQVSYTIDCTVDPATSGNSFSNTATITLADGVSELDPDSNTATDTDFTTMEILVDGFESGDLSAWSAALP